MNDASSFVSASLRIVVIFLLVLANGFFVAAEFALVGVRRSRVAALVASGNRKARTLLRVIEQLDAYISATQLGITLASLALGWIGEHTLAHLLKPVFERVLPGSEVSASLAAHSVAIGVAFATITFLHIVLGELAPKTLALERAERVALFVARPMEVFYRVFKAPIWLLNKSGSQVLRLMGLRSSAEATASYSEEELRQLITLSHKSGHLIEDERRLIYNVFDFTESTVADVMVPRVEVEAIDADLPFTEILQRFIETGYSRIPAYRGSMDNVLGILLYKDVARVASERTSENGLAPIEEVIRPSLFLPTSMRLNDALRRLRASSAHMALVVDEHGGVEGMVTLEDLLEEIVGEISDEHDEAAQRQIVKHADESYTVSGRLSIRSANRRLDLGLPESDSYHTIAGFMISRAGRLLRRGESVVYNHLRLTVEKAARNRILAAKIEVTH
jgi:CBS domain containing-hemolysin-like protein